MKIAKGLNVDIINFLYKFLFYSILFYYIYIYYYYFLVVHLLTRSYGTSHIFSVKFCINGKNKNKKKYLFHQVFPYFWGNIRNLKKEITECNMFCAMGVNDFMCILGAGFEHCRNGYCTFHTNQCRFFMEGLCRMERSQEFGKMKIFQSKMGFWDMEIDFGEGWRL
jgi:hypothetical protein